MPNRILREGILTSARVDRLTDGGELFYRRLMSKADDHGRCEAHPEILRTSCYPLRVDRIKARHIIAWLVECEKAGLLVVYKGGSKSYLQMIDWRQQARAESKYPAPDEALIRKCLADAAHMSSTCVADAHLGGGVGVFEGVGVTSGQRDAPPAPVNGNAVCYIPLNDGTQFGVVQQLSDELAKLYPKVDVPQTLNEIRGWNLANTARRKTRRGILNHINGWMAKEQNRGPKA